MTKVSEVLHCMHEIYRPVLENMMEREGMNGDSTVDEVMKYFLDRKNLAEETVALAALRGAQSRHGVSKFSPQLTFAQRCEILGLHRMGYTADILAQAYKIDRRTVTQFYSKISKKYKNVREEELRLGPHFTTTYVTPEVLAHVETFMTPTHGANNKSASGMAGTHSVRGKGCEYNHRVTIGWCDPSDTDVEVPGWYYKDLDGDFPTTWLRCASDESLKNSKACYAAMLEEITDKI